MSHRVFLALVAASILAGACGESPAPGDDASSDSAVVSTSAVLASSVPLTATTEAKLVTIECPHGDPVTYRVGRYESRSAASEALCPPQVLPVDSFRVVSYNILCGAGVSPDAVPCQQRGLNVYEGCAPGQRLTAVLTCPESGPPIGGDYYEQLVVFLNEIDGDIIGIQEAQQWPETGTDQRLAEDLGLNYVVGPSMGGDNHVVLYTRYEVMGTENYFDHFTRATLRVELETPWTEVLHVFVTHLETVSDPIWQMEWRFLRNELAAYSEEPVILMGDFNSAAGGLGLEKELEEYGYRLVRVDGHRDNDLIFASDTVGIDPATAEFYEVDSPELVDLGISDHAAIIADIGHAGSALND